MDKNVNKGISTEFDSVGYVKQPIKPLPNPPWEKPRFRVKYKMAAIKTVIYVFFFNISLSFEN